jgi:hypothetical protein
MDKEAEDFFNSFVLDIEHIFEQMDEDAFREWLLTDMYGNPIEIATREDLETVLRVFDPYPKLDNFYKIVLEELIKTRDYENEKIKSDRAE